MTDTDPPPAPTRRPRRHFRRLTGVAILLGVLALGAALMVWAARPRWHMFVSKATLESPHVALALRFPVGWECREQLDPKRREPGSISVEICREPPPRLMQWWYEYILRMHTTLGATDRFAISVSTGSPL